MKGIDISEAFVQLHTQFLSLLFLRPFCNLNGTIFFGGLSDQSAAVDKKLGFLQAGREQGRVLLSLTATELAIS